MTDRIWRNLELIFETKLQRVIQTKKYQKEEINKDECQNNKMEKSAATMSKIRV